MGVGVLRVGGPYQGGGGVRAQGGVLAMDGAKPGTGWSQHGAGFGLGKGPYWECGRSRSQVGFPQCALSPTQIRASRLEQIDKELLSAQDRVQQTEPQVPGGAKSEP